MKITKRHILNLVEKIINEEKSDAKAYAGDLGIGLEMGDDSLGEADSEEGEVVGGELQQTVSQMGSIHGTDPHDQQKAKELRLQQSLLQKKKEDLAMAEIRSIIRKSITEMILEQLTLNRRNFSGFEKYVAESENEIEDEIDLEEDDQAAIDADEKMGQLSHGGDDARSSFGGDSGDRDLSDIM
jgi:hypothetical protein